MNVVREGCLLGDEMCMVLLFHDFAHARVRVARSDWDRGVCSKSRSSRRWRLKDEVANNTLLQTIRGQSLFENLAEVHCRRKLRPMNKYV